MSTSPQVWKTKKVLLTLPNVPSGKPNLPWLRTTKPTQLFSFPSALWLWTRYFRGTEETESTQLRLCLLDGGKIRGNQRQGLRHRTQVSVDHTGKRKRPDWGEGKTVGFWWHQEGGVSALPSQLINSYWLLSINSASLLCSKCSQASWSEVKI